MPPAGADATGSRSVLRGVSCHVIPDGAVTIVAWALLIDKPLDVTNLKINIALAWLELRLLDGQIAR